MERKNKIVAPLYRTAVHRKIALLILFLIPSLLFSQETQQTSSPQTNPILYSGNGELILEITPKAGNNDINVVFGSLLTAFNINIHSNTATLKQTPPTEDLTTGEVRLQWTDTKGSLTSKTFVSRKDKVAMTLITADKGINIPNIKVTSPSGFGATQMRTKITPNKQGFAIRSTFRKVVCEGSRRYEGLEAVVKVVPDNGRISVSGNEIKPKKVRQALMFMAMAPSEQMEINKTDSLEKAIENVMATAYAALSSKDEKNISPAIYAELLKRNISVHLSLYNQMTIELPTHKPTDKAIVDTYNRHIYHKLCYSTIPSTYTAHHPSSAAYPSSVPLHQQAEAASLLYDYYLYTLDSLFLREEALPYMINVAEKLQKTLKTKDPQGNYIINKTSPTQEVTAANFLLRDLISSSTFLKVNQNQIQHWQNILAYMPPYKIDRNDQLRDQLHAEQDNHTGQTSAPHLWGLFYRSDPIIIRSYDLRQACSTVIDNTFHNIKFKTQQTTATPQDTKQHQTNNANTQSHIIQLALAAAAVGDGEKAYQILTHTVSCQTTPDTTNPAQSATVFGTTVPKKSTNHTGTPPSFIPQDQLQHHTLITKMIVQSDYLPEYNKAYINLLPAIPQHWEKGEIRGANLRGAITLNTLKWDKTQGVTAKLISKTDITVELYIHSQFTKTISLKKDVPFSIIAKKSQQEDTCKE